MTDAARTYTLQYTPADHLEVVSYTIYTSRRAGFAKTTVRRAHLFGLGITAIFGLFAYLLGGVALAIAGMTLYLIIWGVLSLVSRPVTGFAKNANPASNRKLAERYIRSAGQPTPLGTHSLTMRDGYFDWYWQDGLESVSYPAHAIDSLEESNGRIYFIQGAFIKGSIPIRAFGDRADRAQFEDFHRDARSRHNTASCNRSVTV